MCPHLSFIGPSGRSMAVFPAMEYTYSRDSDLYHLMLCIAPQDRPSMRQRRRAVVPTIADAWSVRKTIAVRYMCEKSRFICFVLIFSHFEPNPKKRAHEFNCIFFVFAPHNFQPILLILIVLEGLWFPRGSISIWSNSWSREFLFFVKICNH